MFSAIEFRESQPGLNDFSSFMSHHAGFPHRFSEHDGKIVLWVYDEEAIPIARKLYQCYLINPDIHDSNGLYLYSMDKKTVWHTLRLYPVTILLTLFSLAGFYLFATEKIELLSLFSFQDFTPGNASYIVNTFDVARYQILNGQFWRLLTPIFLHFDLMHITFNLTVLWFLGRQIERRKSSIVFMLLVVCIGITSNIAQYYFSATQLFGGMSGVNYGLLAYCSYVNHVNKKQVFYLPGGFLIVSLVMMLLGFLNIFSLLGYSIANSAHLAGFLSGLLLAVFDKQLARHYIH